MHPTTTIDTAGITSGSLLIDAIPELLRPELVPALNQLVRELHPEGL